jgi:hypothetical protein
MILKEVPNKSPGLNNAWKALLLWDDFFGLKK